MKPMSFFLKPSYTFDHIRKGALFNSHFVIIPYFKQATKIKKNMLSQLQQSLSVLCYTRASVHFSLREREAEGHRVCFL